MTTDRNETLDALIAQERDILVAVLEILRTTPKRINRGGKKDGVFRFQLMDAIRKKFRFTQLRCSHCKEYLEAGTHFHRDKARKRGYRLICFFCDKMERQERYWRNPEKYRAYQREHHARKNGNT